MKIKPFRTKYKYVDLGYTVVGSTPGRGSFCMEIFHDGSWHVLPVHLWVLTGYSGVLPQSKNMTVRLTGLSKLTLGMNVCVHGCLSCMSLCCSAMDGDLSRVDPASRL
ncbi:hypothetical protein CHARACLAT_013734 [Characodon lateralis]|uniref:Uncharacterized protein n=1 Tax=Characodon lateralis TaxID=208331 RepID=A0ABU7CXD7_9TELE|nr:hypothetical protein [Characodon lateralis]